jgi:hypothetical protein
MFFSRERCRTIWLRRVTWRRNACDPNLRQEAAGIELGQYAGIDLIGFDLRMRNEADLLRVSDYDPTDVRSDHRGNRGRIASGFDDNNVALGQLLANSSSGSRRMMIRPSRLSLPFSQATASAKAR